MVLSVIFSACGGENNLTSQETTYNSDPNTLNIVAGSEQKTILENIVLPWCKSQGLTCNYKSEGSVDQARDLKTGNTPADAYWFASSIFQQLGDIKGQLKDVRNMFISPLVYAGWKSEMQKLGFVGRDDISISEILDAVQNHKTNARLTNPTQSNSGASIYLAFLSHFAGNGPESPLTMEQLNSSKVSDGITKFVRALDQTPPSTGTMMDECVTDKSCKTMFTYEALVIEKNQELTKDRHEPLYAVYPKDSLAIADSPLGFMPHKENTPQKEQTFLKLQKYLLSSEGQNKVLKLGRRPANSGGLSLTNPDTTVFNPDWGIRSSLEQQVMVYPRSEVIDTALNKYQTSYRQPTDMVYCLDGSGSMNDNGGWDDLRKATSTLFQQDIASQYYLQAHPDDVTSVLIFDDKIENGSDGVTVKGNDSSQLKSLYDNLPDKSPGGGTDFYLCLIKATQLFKQDGKKHFIILMTDGDNNGSTDRNDMENAVKAAGVPIISVPFGDDAKPDKLAEISSLVPGGLVVQKENLVASLREATGYR